MFLIIKKILCMIALLGSTAFSVFDTGEFEQSKKLPNDITFIAVDFKVDKATNKIKIFEAQDGPNGGFRAYDELVGTEKGGVWGKFWEHLATFNLPVWYVGLLDDKVKEGVFSHFDRKRLAIDTLLSLGGYYAPFSTRLKTSHAFMNRKLSEHGVSGIIVAKNEKPLKSRRKIYSSRFKNKREAYSDLIVVNNYSRKFIGSRDKKPLIELLDKNDLHAYRPQSKIYQTKYSTDLAEQILNDLGCDKVVIKPLALSRSRGVIVASTLQELDELLQVITHKHVGSQDRDKNSLFYDWLTIKKEAFLVEEFIESESVFVNEKWYEPTIRMVLVMSCIDNKISIDCIEGFKKIPPHSLDDKCSLTNRVVSKYRDDMGSLSFDELKITDEEMMNLQKQLREIFWIIYPKMLVA